MMYHLTGCLQYHLLYMVWHLEFRISEAVSTRRHSFSTTCPKTAELQHMQGIQLLQLQTTYYVTGKLIVDFVVDATDQ